MWKRLSKYFLIYCISIIILVFIVFPYYISRIVEKNILNSYVKNKYYILCKEMSIKYIGNNAHANIRGVHGDRHRWWISAYEMKMPFMGKTFEVWIDKRNNKIFGSDFSDVLTTDVKFQHLYSEWVKKQVGIEDENVELEFSCGGIDFLKIEYLSEDMAEIFRNAKMHCKDVRVYNLKDLNFENSYSYALEYKKKIADKVFEVAGVPKGGMTTWIHLYSSDEYSGEQYYFKYKSDNPSELLRSKV